MRAQLRIYVEAINYLAQLHQNWKYGAMPSPNLFLIAAGVPVCATSII